MDTKLLGGTLLIVGTAIGAGMLALPIATAQLGFFYSFLLLFFCWFIMTAGALLTLEVNLWLPKNNNLIAMTKTILGKPAQAIAWLTYLLLFYSVVAAYISGGSDFLCNLLKGMGVSIPTWGGALLFTGILGTIVYWGIRPVDYVNRGLMFVKLSSYFLLLIFVLPHISVEHLKGGEFYAVAGSMTVALTSFGFTNVIPSLRVYLHDDVPKLRKAILIGSLIPLACYILWELVIMGVIAREGNNGLLAMMRSGHSTSAFIEQLNALLHQSIISSLSRTFTSICLATSFLGVSLGLSDFLADGFSVERKGWANIFVAGAAFLPPLTIALFWQNIFIKALSYAGVYCMIIMVLFPALMAWQGRYRKIRTSYYQVAGGKPLLIGLILVSVYVIAEGICMGFGLH